MIIPTIINKGSIRKPKRGEEISTIKMARKVSRKITINHILKIFCIE
jgi:hypothetical protein